MYIRSSLRLSRSPIDLKWVTTATDVQSALALTISNGPRPDFDHLFEHLRGVTMLHLQMERFVTRYSPFLVTALTQL